MVAREYQSRCANAITLRHQRCKILKILLILLATGLIFPAFAGSPEGPVRLAADVWCPHTCAASDANQGFLVELAAGVFEQAGMAVEYSSTAWRRAIKGAEGVQFDVLLGAAPDEPNLLLASGFALRDDTVFVVDQSSTISITGPDDLAAYRLGRIQEYDYSDAGIWYPALMENARTLLLPSSQGEFRLLELVLIKRLDVAVVNRNVAAHFALANGEQARLRVINPKIHSYLYFGFQPSERGKQLHQLFEQHLPVFRESKEFTDLLAKYRLDAGLVEGH